MTVESTAESVPATALTRSVIFARTERAPSPFTLTLITPPRPARATQEALIDALDAAFAAGATTVDKSPPTRATTAVCAMRLSRDVFVDIDFLSLVVKKTFSFTAGKEKLFAS